MTNITLIFERIEKLTKIDTDTDPELISALLLFNKPEKDSLELENIFDLRQTFLNNIFKEIDDLAKALINDNSILISVKNQKLLRTCFQLIISLGVSPSLIPGLGISLSKRCTSSTLLPPIHMKEEEKYEILVNCTNFFVRSYTVPVLKSIIMTFHLSDYLAALIQLSFAPIKRPGIYTDFIMTQEMYDNLNLDKRKYSEIYAHLVNNCFQPILMKELLVLQNASDQNPPPFVKRVIAKEMSQRLTKSGGLLSLIRCFIDSYEMDTGVEWKKIELISKIIATKHGNTNEIDYLHNICSQLRQILTLNNVQYLGVAMACIMNLTNKYSELEPVKVLVQEVFDSLNYESLITREHLPGTIILTSQEIEHRILIFHSCLCLPNLQEVVKLMNPNLYLIFLFTIKCSKGEFKLKLNSILLKCLEKLDKNDVYNLTKLFLFGRNMETKVSVEEYDTGLLLKCVKIQDDYPTDDALLCFINLFKMSADVNFAQCILEACLKILTDLSQNRHEKQCKESLLDVEDVPILLNELDKQYFIILQLLSVISEASIITNCLKLNPVIALNFIEHFLIQNSSDDYDECVTIALTLLNTILLGIKEMDKLQMRLKKLIPVLKKIAENELNANYILCNETISLICGKSVKEKESAYSKALSNVFNNLLPTRAHGIIELTKLIQARDKETLSKRHYLFCLFQEQLKDSDSYIYLAAINAIASLAMYCAEDVLAVLCKEFLNVSTEMTSIETIETQNQIKELRMKVGDIVVKVTRRLGDMCISHKTILLNTMLTGCRDDDPLIRASALSNLAEIALVLHYKIGTIIFEVLLCIESIIDTDKAIECRRAAVMVISSLLKGLGKDSLIQLKENLIPLYKTLRKLYKDSKEDDIVRLHAQIALEELDDIVKQFLYPTLQMEKKPIILLDQSRDVIYK